MDTKFCTYCRSRTSLNEILFQKLDEVMVIERNRDCVVGALYQYNSVG